jgi:hypothetical protein
MGSEVARLVELLVLHRGWSFCHACLAFELKLSLSEVRGALGRARVDAVLERGQGTCATCGRQTLIVAATAAPESPTEERILTVLADDRRRTRGVCHACITRLAQIPYSEVRKVVARLRLAAVELRVGPCVECGRYRMVVCR